VNIIPVIDIKNGIAVRGVAGERNAYRPVQSRWTNSHDVIDVAEAIRDHFGLNAFYLADLDAILADAPNAPLFEALSGRGFSLAVDAGLRDVRRAEELLAAGVQSVIAGLETLPGQRFLGHLTQETGPDRVIFSLDLHGGQPVLSEECIRQAATGHATASPLDWAAFAIDAGVRRMIVLDLAAVGVGDGPATLPLCRKLRDRFPHIELSTGGGVRSADDLRELQQAGVDGVLIASALHNGAIMPGDVRGIVGS